MMATGSLDCTIVLSDITARSPVHTLRGHSCGVTLCTFCVSDSWLASVDRSYSIFIWDTVTGNLLRRFTSLVESKVSGLVINASGTLIVCNGAFYAISVLDAQTGLVVQSLSRADGVAAAFSQACVIIL
jgi:WD40 repeat protein